MDDVDGIEGGSADVQKDPTMIEAVLFWEQCCTLF